MFTHPFHDIEIAETAGGTGEHLVKILAQDGHRFTYLLRCELDEGAVEFVRRMIDGGVSSDLTIEKIDGSFRAEETLAPLPRHS